MEECTVHAEGFNSIEFEIFCLNYASRPRIGFVYPTKKVHCYKLTLLINLSKTPNIPGLNFLWKKFPHPWQP
jgi:hypothetical protein